MSAFRAKRLWDELLALGDVDHRDDNDEDQWGLIHQLHENGDARIVDWALPLLQDAVAWKRQLASMVLGQLGYQHGRPYGEIVLPALVDAARREKDPATRPYFISALGHSQDVRGGQEILRHATDAEENVRYAVAMALPNFWLFESLQSSIVSTLLSLTLDEDSDVRDWATFGLGHLEFDSPAVREALWNRVYDIDEDTRDEAVHGLARRRDTRVLELVADRLRTNSTSMYTFNDAALMADPSLLPLLQECESVDETEDLARDLAEMECNPERRQARNHKAWQILTLLTERVPEAHFSLQSDRFAAGLELSALRNGQLNYWSVEALLVRAEQDAKYAVALIQQDQQESVS